MHCTSGIYGEGPKSTCLQCVAAAVVGYRLMDAVISQRSECVNSIIIVCLMLQLLIVCLTCSHLSTPR